MLNKCQENRATRGFLLTKALPHLLLKAVAFGIALVVRRRGAAAYDYIV